MHAAPADGPDRPIASDQDQSEGVQSGGRIAEPPRDRKEQFELDPEFDIFEDEEDESRLGEPFTDAVLQARVAEIAPRVAEMRGMEWKHDVPAGLQSADEFIEFAIDDFEQEYGMETFRAMSEAYRLLGLIDPEMDLFETTMDLLRGQVGGYYDPRTKRFYMIDSYRQGATADIILAHELTHALDDQYFDLQALMEGADSADKEFAIRAVVEGSGTSLMNLYAVRGALSGWLELDPVAMMAEMEGQSESLKAAPAYLIMTLALPYMEGNKLLTRKTNVLEASMTAPSDADLRAAFANPPRSSEQVLHIEKYWDPAQVDEPIEVETPLILDFLSDEWVLSHEDTLGELGCYVMTAETLPDLTTAAGQLAGRWTNAAATGWGGDRYASFSGPGGARLLVWDSIWDTESDAVEFAVALKRDPAPRNAYLLDVNLSGNRVFAYFANEAGAAVGRSLAEMFSNG
jgi:hypothetical protein